MSSAFQERSQVRYALACLLALALLGGCSAGTSDGGEIGGVGGVSGGGGGGTTDPAPAPTPVPSLSAAISWAAASGPVAGYHVLMSRNDGAFSEVAVTTAASVTVDGAQGDVVRVRVAAFDAQGNRGPLSEPSDPFVFVGGTTTTSASGGDATTGGSGAPQLSSGSSGTPTGDPAPSDSGTVADSGTPTATDPASQPAPSDSSEPAARASLGDLDGDGTDDLVWQSEDGALVRVTSADLTRASLYSLPDAGWRVAAVGDFDGDGLPDLLFAAPGELALANGTALRAGPGELTLEPWAYLPADAALAASGDFDGDGSADAAVVGAEGASLWLAGGDVLALPASPSGATIAAAGDADGDGSDDLLWAGTEGVSLWRLVAGAVSGVSPVSTPEGAALVAFADLDDDGAAELALRTAATAITVGDVLAPFASWQETAPADASLAGCGDYDGDGARDRLWQDAASLHLVSAAGEQQIALDATSPWHLFRSCK